MNAYAVYKKDQDFILINMHYLLNSKELSIHFLISLLITIANNTPTQTGSCIL